MGAETWRLYINFPVIARAVDLDARGKFGAFLANRRIFDWKLRNLDLNKIFNFCADRRRRSEKLRILAKKTSLTLKNDSFTKYKQRKINNELSFQSLF